MYRPAIMFAIFTILCSIATFTLGVPLLERNYDPREEVVAYDDVVYAYNPENPQLRAENMGYRAETHEAVTEDGHILKVFRITGRKDRPVIKNKPAVLLLHGLMDCASGWLISCREKSLGFMLADAGYDVWLGNARGSRYAREHKWLTTKEKRYWLFSWHEIGKYDVPAMIDCVLGVSKQKKLIYVGHSQGTTSFFVFASLRPEYHRKVEAMFALAPVAFMGETSQPLLRILAPFANDIKKLADQIGMYEFMPTQGLIHKVADMICGQNTPLRPICDTAMVFMMAFGEKFMNQSLVTEIVKYDPAGASSRQFVHYAQLINSGKFREYDHGWLENLKQYGSISPPDYPVEKIRIPIYLHYSRNDDFAPINDVYKLYKKLPDVTRIAVPEPAFSHVDFIWGTPVDTQVYRQVLSLMKRHSSPISN